MAVKTITTQQGYITGSATSKDGTTIGYRQLGRGPGLLVLHGSMQSAHSHMELAEALADHYTVYLPDRRGRGMSGAYRQPYNIQNDVEDIDALLTKTGAHDVFGISSGAIVLLNAALQLPSIRRAAIFEPPLITEGSLSIDFLPRFDQQIAEGKTAAALVTGMLGAQLGPPVFNKIPRVVLELLTRMMMDRKTSPDDISMRTLAPTLHYDFQLVSEMEGKTENYRGIRAEVLLMGGSASPAYLKTSVQALEHIIPHARRIEFPGLGHSATGPAAMGGKPEIVAQTLREFFT